MNSCTEALWDEPIMVKVNKLAEAAAMMERREWQIMTAAGNKDAADYYRNEYRREKELKNQIYNEICAELGGNSDKPRKRADGGLIVLRERAVLTDRIQIGDRIAISIMGASYTATAIRQEQDGTALFLLDECLKDARPMNARDNADGGYEGSDLRKFLRSLEYRFSQDIGAKLVPFENGDAFRLLTLQEACGCDKNWEDAEGQIEWMKDVRHKAAARNNEMEWYWLQDVVSGVAFADVSGYGLAGSNHASLPYGIRPAFKIANP